ncbi:AGE family epimerase/isomerase [Occultella gossypii]|uniref:AGE family epimerase/isomerase n=1 Tax=Occultella gossypii TaxID=2800820 RepID=A0ABS7S659_9MICO|nr:AGE family epimerase/isomerase [Occultella gossypii]MBZ2195567.1 AGE family epimerase/isomerase [Occultella gossypii]
MDDGGPPVERTGAGGEGVLIDSPGHRLRLDREARRLLEFGRAARLPEGGFGWLDATGVPTPGRPRMLYVTCRMTHAFALGTLLGVDGSAELVDHGLQALRGLFGDRAHGGWFTSVGADGPADDRKWSYPHAFVVLAAASAATIGRPGATELLDDALHVMAERFWDEEAGMVVEQWDVGFTRLDPERGANANMHAVEAFLAAWAATGRDVWRDRALRIGSRMVDVARRHEWRLPEHYDAAWHPALDRYRDRPRDPFKPFGATPGHGLEWARLLVQLHLAYESAPGGSPAWLIPAAEQLADAAVRDGWHVDGAPGFVYTVDWEGTPVIRSRLHWVTCEALGAAAMLWQVTGDERHARRYETWWAYAERYLIDELRGSWHHELDEHNAPSATIRDGKADAYHALQAVLLPRLPPTAAVAPGVARLRAH